MNSEAIESVDEELRKLEKFGSGIIGNAIVSRNGLLITSRLPLDIDNRKFGAMAAALFNGMETAVETLESKEIRNITVELDNYQIIALTINDQLFLVTLSEYSVNFGLILIELEEFIRKIKIIING